MMSGLEKIKAVLGFLWAVLLLSMFVFLFYLASYPWVNDDFPIKRIDKVECNERP